MTGFLFNSLLLTVAALPVFFSKPNEALSASRSLAAVVSLCLCAMLSALLYSNGGTAPGSLGLFCALIFLCALLLVRSKSPLSRLYEAALRSSASLFPLAISYMLSGQWLSEGELFAWPSLLLLLLFALPCVFVPRFLSKGGTPGELGLPDERPISPCVIMLILELSVPVCLVFGQSVPFFSAVMLILCLCALLFAEALWCEASLFALHFSATPIRRQLELEYMVELGREASERLRRQAAQERSARAIGEARLYAMENSLLSGVTAEAPDADPADVGPAFCAFPMLDSLMRRCREGAAARGIAADILLRLDTLGSVSEAELCVLFRLALDPVLAAPALPEARDALIRIRALETPGYLSLSAGCRGLALEPDAEKALISAMSQRGGWAERSQSDGFSVLSLLLFK